MLYSPKHSTKIFGILSYLGSLGTKIVPTLICYVLVSAPDTENFKNKSCQYQNSCSLKL